MVLTFGRVGLHDYIVSCAELCTDQGYKTIIRSAWFFALGYGKEERYQVPWVGLLIGFQTRELVYQAESSNKFENE